MTDSRIVWLIVTPQNKAPYYLKDYDELTNTAMWTLYEHDARIFTTAKSITTFLSTYFNSRNDIYIVETYNNPS